MRVNKIQNSYLNVSGNIYDSEYINLANVKENRIAFDDRTLFLTDEEKMVLNNQEIRKFKDVIYLFNYHGVHGIVCDVPIEEYDVGKIKCHELVIPEIVQGMISNLYGYNCEVAPVLLAHNKTIDYKVYINSGKYINHYEFDGVEVYVFTGSEAKKIISEFEEVNRVYVADGHHRLYTTSLSKIKDSVLSCLVNFDDVKILPIHRVLKDVEDEQFINAKNFMEKKLEILEEDTEISKGIIKITYKDKSFSVRMVELMSDVFWNNDIYRLNTQIISQAFRIFDTKRVDYILGDAVNISKYVLQENDVLSETYPVDKYEFIHCADNGCIMPPKSTCFYPKFPSFLVFKQYND